ncbi:5'-AMP-activated protein kinase subunit beta-2 isoform X1 [Octopus bimaculoides]|uniref:5'-AMP-activated protein kinase subunit beta-1 n=1 Tax=Octopus bimaculoides TaxID=37653 RepID=A0A0L8H7B2_OCTBM|nr:5'-AMP-activated protein kinase subunit beta-2 isoform X1 [Octopus bimaculoides]|eukprot:XP_014774817.1 PREDICTED: 5'-AMP-activated protein kinase subunit beta-2-like isoform X1 [Octopus bimaculoides]
MGNTTSGKRHNSGDDAGPTITANRLGDISLEDDFAPSLFKTSRPSRDLPLDTYQRPRSNTVTHSPTLVEKCLPTVFRWEGAAKEVCLSGSFNNWKNTIPLAKSTVRLTDRSRQRHDSDGNGDFFTILNLPEGEHQYKFYVDGQWLHDQNEPTVPNSMGTLNNVVVVNKSDFEVFEALAIDSENSGNKRKNDVAGSPSGDYGQEIPPRRSDKIAGPPFIPPHLLQVILNKDTPAHCEPILLPEPNHVMLNHLYALSIKDGVMVLSTTHRFRKKYVTTLLYKPI